MRNYSKQREEIIKILKELNTHPTAEEIYYLAKKRDPAISKSTVYRNLNTFVENGIITQIAISNGPDRYDYIEGKEKHGYVHCMKCGEIFDFNYIFDEFKNNILGQTNVEIFQDGIVVKGICNSCKKLLY